MNSIQIQCFLSAAGTGNYSRTAEDLMMEQPAVSRYIHRMEEELDVRLFIRQGRTMRLTSAGEKYYDLFQRFQNEFNELNAQIRHADQPSHCLRYTIASVWSLPEILLRNQRNFQNRHPNISTTFVCCSYDSLVSSIYDSNVDVVFHMTKYMGYFEDLEYEKIASLPNIVIYSEKHPMMKSGQPSFKGLDGSDILYLESEINSGYAGENARKFLSERYGIDVHPLAVRDYETLISLVENGQAILMMDSWCHAQQFRNLRYLTTDRMEDIGIGWKKGNRNPAIRSFIEETKRFFEQNSGDYKNL